MSDYKNTFIARAFLSGVRETTNILHCDFGHDEAEAVLNTVTPSQWAQCVANNNGDDYDAAFALGKAYAQHVLMQNK